MQMNIGSSQHIKGFPKKLKVKANWGYIVDEVTLPSRYCRDKYLRYGMQKKFLQSLLPNCLCYLKQQPFWQLSAIFVCRWVFDKDVLFVAFDVSGAKLKTKHCLNLNWRPNIFILDVVFTLISTFVIYISNS